MLQNLTIKEAIVYALANLEEIKNSQCLDKFEAEDPAIKGIEEHLRYALNKIETN